MQTTSSQHKGTQVTAAGAKTAAGILLVEDEALFANAVKRRLEKSGFRCNVAANLVEAQRHIASALPDLLLLDLRLPDGNGLEFLERLHAGSDGDAPPVVVLTAYGGVSDAVHAMKLGASDFLRKPIDLDELVIAVEQVLHQNVLRHRLDYSRQRDSHAVEGALLLGTSPAIQQVRNQVERLAGLEGMAGEPLPTVLIAGETGTGKDVAAKLLHLNSRDADRPFVHVDCTALPRDLMEAELFGHEKGAFTGAHGARTGLIEAAEDGCVFLDEIGELPLELQAKLLTVIERRRTRRIGSLREHAVTARFIAATNRNLGDMIAQGRFRSDLYYRINVVTLTMPPLRARGDDVLLLAGHFLELVCRRYGLGKPSLSGPAKAAMLAYNWPGNVRELKHLVERAVLLSHGHEITADSLALPVGDVQSGPAESSGSLAGLTLDEAERRLIVEALETTHGNVSEAARRLVVSRMTLRYRMEKHGLKGD